VARRAAAAHHVELGSVRGSGPNGRITKADVLAADHDNGAEPAAAPAEAQAIRLKGAPAMLAQYMERSRELPTATSFRTLAVTTLAGRRGQLKAGGRRVSFTHLIAYAIAQAAVRMPQMTHHYEERDGQPHRIDDGAINLGLAIDVQRKDGGSMLMVPVVRDAGRVGFAAFLERYDEIVSKARANKLTADDLTGANISLTNPGGIGTVASVPRLQVGQGTIVATGAIAYPPGLEQVGEALGAEQVMTMTSTYDHRIIQGAESGRFLALIEAHLQGEHAFYEDVFQALGVALGEAPQTPRPSAQAFVQAEVTSERADAELLQAVQAATSLVKAHRSHGHLAAHLDPLGTEPLGDPALDPETVGLTDELMRRIPTKVLRVYVEGDTLAEALPHLRETYCGTIAYEIEHLASHRERVWLREHIESGAFRRPLEAEQRKRLLRRLTQVDSFERFLRKQYLGAHSFSIEGLDMTVGILDEVVQLAGAGGAREVVMGMGHRGRLNVLAHILGRSYETLFAEFEGASNLKAVTTLPQGGTGDVKYHHGAVGSSPIEGREPLTVTLESNPSHLEACDPATLGATRAAQTDRGAAQAQRDTGTALAVLMHGDASFPAQGTVAETLNLQSLDGYGVGGTLHLIQNNQLGFTTEPDDGRSTRWASDLAKGFDVPIVHVNADDVEACIAAARLAFAFREQFGHDVLIDLIGYRRLGHNESDEPRYTQPEMYARIDEHPPVREVYARKLIDAGVVSQEEADAMSEEVWSQLRTIHDQLKERIERDEPIEQQTGEYELDRSRSPEIDTAVPADRLRALNEDLLRLPEGFEPNRKLVSQLKRRRDVVDAEDGRIDWATAESLALGSLLCDAVPVRFTGQDSERGTFSQRHWVFHDTRTGQQVAPILGLPEAKAPMELHNSPLSELAVLGFEYGYSAEAQEVLVCWEAQYGDFVNGAQVIIDQFIVSGLAKWGQTCRLTLLLPHAYEGQGPEHSSARLERFLQLAAEGNIRVANPTTPAQYFHLLRRQALIPKQRPLVVMTPKRLLRLAQATSPLSEMATGRFQPTLDDPDAEPEAVHRLVLCSGKIYYDLTADERRAEASDVAIVRVELLYPFPRGEIRALLARYPNLTEVVWAQEEPRNAGARAHMSPRLMQLLPESIDFGYIGRPEHAAPSEGYPVAHNEEQDRIILTALDTGQAVSAGPVMAGDDR
jgi:2-oxoglutarate dehydrogenase E1 component